MQPPEAKPIAAWRKKAALAALGVWAVAALFFDTRWSAPLRTIQNMTAGEDDRSIYFKRFKGFYGDFKWPRTFGYVADSPTEDWFQDHLYSTRFALAPMMVEKGTNFEWVIGNFHPPEWMTEEMLLKRVRQSYPQLGVEVVSMRNGVYAFYNGSVPRKQAE